MENARPHQVHSGIVINGTSTVSMKRENRISLGHSASIEINMNEKRERKKKKTIETHTQMLKCAR